MQSFVYVAFLRRSTSCSHTTRSPAYNERVGRFERGEPATESGHRVSGVGGATWLQRCSQFNRSWAAIRRIRSR
jgi:hypothetical protein